MPGIWRNCANVTVDPYYAHVPLNARLVWRSSEEAPWAIAFLGKRTPTDTLVIHGIGELMDDKHLAAQEGHFPYAVAVQGQVPSVLDGKTTIFLDARCPEIIIP